MKRSDFSFTLHATSHSRVVTLSLKLTNESPNSYWLSQDSVYMNGIRNSDFRVIGPSPVVCNFQQVYFGLFNLGANQSITTSVVLSEPCAFHSVAPGMYLFQKRNTAFLFNKNIPVNEMYKAIADGADYISLEADSTFMIDDSDIAKNVDLTGEEGSGAEI